MKEGSLLQWVQVLTQTIWNNISSLEFNLSFNNQKDKQREIINSKMYKNLFKLVFTIDNVNSKTTFFETLNVEIRSENNLKMYFGTNQVFYNAVDNEFKIFNFKVDSISFDALKNNYSILLAKQSKFKTFSALVIDSRSNIFLNH